MDLSDDKVRAEADRREIDPPIQVQQPPGRKLASSIGG
jgi:hypothetical protein